MTDEEVRLRAIATMVRLLIAARGYDEVDEIIPKPAGMENASLMERLLFTPDEYRRYQEWKRE